MADPPAQPNGSASWRPRLPLGIVIGAIAVALLAVSGLIYLLYTRTVGPAEVLRSFAEHLDKGECAAAYELLEDSFREGTDEARWCSEDAGRLDAVLDEDFDFKRVVYHRATEIAEVRISGVAQETWRLRRTPDGNSWFVIPPSEVPAGP